MGRIEISASKKERIRVVEVDEKTVEMLKEGVIVAAGHQADVREVIEKMIAEKLGFCPDLQEDTEEGEYLVYVHSEGLEELSEVEIGQLEALRITEDPERSTEAIGRLLGVSFYVGDKHCR